MGDADASHLGDALVEPSRGALLDSGAMAAGFTVELRESPTCEPDSFCGLQSRRQEKGPKSTSSGILGPSEESQPHFLSRPFHVQGPLTQWCR